jgi:hypothetical protein
MKRYICMLVASTFLVSTVKAQLSYGIKAGGAVTAMPEGHHNTRDKVGYYAGVFGAVPLHKHFSLQAELNYSAQGDNQWLYYSDGWDPVIRNFTPGSYEKDPFRLNYLNLPVLVKYKTRSGFFAEAGLQAGWLISAHFKTSHGRFDVKDDYKSFDLSGSAGAGYQFRNGLGVDLRYNRSLISILNPDFYSFSSYNSVAQLGLFYVLSKR